MSLHSVLRSVREAPPRVVQVVRGHNEGTVDPKRLTARQIGNRVGTLLPEIARGNVPLDDPTMQQGVGRAIEKLWAEQEKTDV